MLLRGERHLRSKDPEIPRLLLGSLRPASLLGQNVSRAVAPTWRQDTGEDSPPETLGELPPTQALPGVLREGPRTCTAPPARAPARPACHPGDWLQVPSRSVTATMATQTPNCPLRHRQEVPVSAPVPHPHLPGAWQESRGLHRLQDLRATPANESRCTENTCGLLTPVPTWRASVPFSATSLSPEFSWAPP